MPANLTPEYKEAEKRYREARTVEEKILALEEMLAVIPKHKGTEKLQADIKRRLSKLRSEPRKKGAKRGFSYTVEKEGAGQTILAGLANCGKSSIVSKLTNAPVIVADYPYSTRQPVPGMMNFENVQIQLVDMPPIAYEDADPWYANLSRTCDLIALVLDVTDEPATQLELILEELARWRVRPEKAVKDGDESAFVLKKRMIVLATKADLAAAQEPPEEVRAVAAGLPVLAVSAKTGLGLEDARRAIFDSLNLVRVYTKTPGKEPDLEKPFVLPRGSKVADLAREIHQDIEKKLKYARIWGKGKFQGQRVNKDWELADEDIVELRI